MQIQQEKQSSLCMLTLQHEVQQQSVLQTFLHDSKSTEKRELEQFISDTFSHYYNARLLNFYPYLLGAYDEEKQPYAAVGYRLANEHRLFLEQYLDQPIEQALEHLESNQDQQTPLLREHIVEIGNLAAIRHGACRDLLQLLTLYFHSSQFRWIVFTGTRAVRVLVRRMRLTAYDLTAAKADALQATAQKSWGSYYDQQPRVMAIPVNQKLSNHITKYSIHTNYDQETL